MALSVDFRAATWMSVIGCKADMPLIAAGAIDCFARADNIVRVGLNYQFH
jgi:hypothetical protein